MQQNQENRTKKCPIFFNQAAAKLCPHFSESLSRIRNSRQVAAIFYSTDFPALVTFLKACDRTTSRSNHIAPCVFWRLLHWLPEAQ